jgi:1-phosphofructokinase family hexose kinase
MILTAGLTPAWQQTSLFDHFSLGEVNRAIESHWCASGKVLNAGLAVQQLGGPSRVVAPLGGPARGLIEQEFNEQGVDARWIITQATTRVCSTIIDRGRREMTELVEEAPPLTDDELDGFLTAYSDEAAEAEVAILIGSLPQGVPTETYRDLVETTACPVILDFRGAGLRQTLDLNPLLVKPNRAELANTVERPLPTDDDVHQAMRELNTAGATWVMVTQGFAPLWLSSKDQLFRLQPIEVDPVINSIGCGDSMAAALAWGVREGMPMVDAARLAVAAAAENLTTLLPGRFDGRRAHLLAERVEVEQV